MKKNSVGIKGKDSCCGCGNCSLVCPKNAIQMHPDREGFEYPTINEDICIHCGKCLKVCPFEIHEDNAVSADGIQCYSGYYNTDEELLSTSSGGVATAISKRFIDNSGVVYGTAFSEDSKEIIIQRVVSVKDLSKLKGSKYAQTYKKQIFLDVKKDLFEGNKVLYIGLPCEIVALKKFITDNKNLYTVELICSGITSQLVHKYFVEHIESTTGKQITHFTYRCKDKGWHWPVLRAYSHNNICYSKLWSASLPGYAFKTFMRHSCYNCQFKGVYNKADITIGDFGGLKKTDPRYNPNGVSAIMVHNEKGSSLIQSLQGFTLSIANYDEILKGNPRLRSCLPKPINRDKFGDKFANKGLLVACQECRTHLDVFKDRIKELMACVKL